MDEFDILFSDIEAEELDSLLENIDTPTNPELAERLKNRLSVKSGSKRTTRIKFILPLAAAFCVVFACLIAFGVKNGGFIPHTKPAPTTTTQSPPESNPLMVAISSGNDDIIPELLSLPGLITKETLEFALNLSEQLSYTTIHQIALSVQNKLGTTGLDALLESALLGNSEKAITELRAREKMLMTPFERLAFFFAVAFCDSEVVEEFINRGYDINTKDSLGNSIYAIAVKYGNEDTKQFAVSRGITS